MKKYIVTGGSSGMGYAISSKLLEAGNEVLIISRHAESSDLLKYKNCVAKNADLSNIDQINNVIDWYKKKKKLKEQLIDGLINCAGIGWGNSLLNITEEEYEKIFSINVKGLIFMTKAALPLMKESGIICNFSSIAGIKGFAEWSIYCSSKYAVEGFTQSIRHELRSKKIRVVSIRPGSVDTPFYAGLKPEQKVDFIKPQTIVEFVSVILNMPKEAIVEEIFINNSVGDL